MSLDWFEFHPKAFVTDTMRLNTEAKGAYLLLLLDYYEKEAPAPDDDDVLAAITGLPVETWQRHRKVIQPLFQIEDGLWRHATCDQVIIDAHARIKSRKGAATTAANARWNRKAPRMPNAMRHASETQSVTHSSRNAPAEADFGPSVTSPSHNSAGGGTETPKNASDMRDASVTECVGNASAMHSNSNQERREGANAPSQASGGLELIGSLIDPAFVPSAAACELAKSEGVLREMAGWLDEWKARCFEAGTRVVNWHDAWDREYHRRMAERAKTRPKPRVAVSKKPKLTKLPDDWMPNPGHHAITSERGLDMQACIESFADYIVNKHPDWRDADAAFRNWLKSPHRTEFKRNGQTQPARRAPAPGGSSILDAGARFEQRLDAELARGRAATQDQPDGDAAVLSLPEE